MAEEGHGVVAVAGTLVLLPECLPSINRISERILVRPILVRYWLLNRLSEELLNDRFFGTVEYDARRRLADVQFISEVGERTLARGIVVPALERVGHKSPLTAG